MSAQSQLFVGPGAAEVAAHVLFDIGVVALIGAGIAGAYVFERAPHLLRRLLPVAWTIAAAGAGMIAVLRYRDIGDMGLFLSTPLGRATMIRIAGLVAAHEALLVALLARPAIARRGFAAAAVAGAVAAFGHTLSSHAGVGAGPALKIVVQTLHIVAVGMWIGGLGATLLSVRGAPDSDKAAAVRRFSGVAAVAIFVVAGTGILRAVNEIGGIAPLVQTGYGRLILAKSQLFILIAGFGARNRLRHVPAARHSLRGLRRAGSAEIAVAVVVIGLSGLLSGTAPAREVYAAEHQIPIRPVQVLRLPNGPTLYDVDTGAGTSLQVYFEPDRPGVTEAHFTFFGDDGKEVPVESLHVTIVRGGRADGTPRRFSPGHFLLDLARHAEDLVVEVDARTDAGGRVRAAFTLTAR